ncbi:MAG: hypothetical protein VKO65_09540 [Cyanobacteriota bacterium]|nr:hypothetical protein [Cyanobacteriota bacterium]
MEQNNNDTLIGIGVVFAGLLVLVVITYWKIVLGLGLLVGAGALLIRWSTHRAHERLEAIAAAADRRFAGDVFRFGDRYGRITRVQVAGLPGQGRFQVLSELLEDGAEGIRLRSQSQQLTPPADLAPLASSRGIGRFLAGEGIAEVGDLAVEARATQAAIECLRETEWTAGALERLEELIRSTRRTLAKAAGNELLEPSIPQLQEALEAFSAEERKLREAGEDAGRMLGKLMDFLSVPEELRPILNFDLDQLFDPQRLQSLERSFEEVVLINDTFRDLCRDRLA